MGIVVLRSTTPWVAVSSRNNSNLLTVISMVPVAVATSTGITESPVWRRYFLYFVISNQKPIKPAVTVGISEKWKSVVSPVFPLPCHPTLHVQNRTEAWWSPYQIQTRLQIRSRLLHSFHIRSTESREEETPVWWKTLRARD